MSLWLSVTIIGAILYSTSNQEELIAATSCFEYFIVLILGSSIITAYQQSNERISLNLVVCFSLIAATSTVFIYWHISQAGSSWPLFVTVDVYIFIAIFLTSKYINECIKAKWNRNQITLERTPSINSGDFKTLDQFKSWFKDDSTIKSTEELEPDLQVYAKRITERLQNGGDKYEKNLAQHIVLCGPYGCGKSSIVESIVNDLAKNSEKESTWIHSDISTWGAASGSVAHVVLSHIIDNISQYIDMCAFRALPKHYTEALKSGGSVFQFASTLLAGPVDIEGSFQKLNDVLDATNHKLLITLQDVDRGTGDENEKRLNDIAALLDRLKDKNLSNINFIVAMGNEKPAFEDVISKATDYREDIAKSNFKDLLVDYIYENLTKSKVIAVIPYSWKKLDDIKNSSTKRTAFYLTEITELNKLIPSFRTLKKVLRRANEVWWKNNLKGEVNFISLLMVLALREVKPSLFSNYLNFVDSAKLNSELVDVEKFLEKDTPSDLKEYLKVMLNIKINTVEIKDSDPPKERDIWLLNPNKEYLQTVGCTNDMSYYIQRITRQSISNGEFIDQDVIKDILKLTKLPLSEFVEEWLSFDEYKQEKYSQFIFLRFNEDETLAYQESGNYNLSIKWSPEKCRHVIKFVHYLAKDLTLENMYMLFNQLFNAKDDYEKFNTLICYLGVEGFSGDLKTLKESQIGFLILKLLQISFNKLAPNTSSIPSERDKLASFLKPEDMTFSEGDGVRLLNADCLQLQYDDEKSRSQNK
ncbi:P-loop NTPase fold protein [Pseudoalteromonas aliena]|nr:P-loop NTPase fold protein [Pseudoalteromonas aliena]